VTALVGPLRTGVAARTVDLVVAWSVFSSQSVPRSELESLMQEFGAQPTVFPTGKPEPGSWSVPIAGGELIVSEAAGDLRAMPPRMIDAAGTLLGRPPVYCLSIFPAAGRLSGSASVEDDKETAALVRRIVNAFAARWPAVLSDNTTNPMIPLGSLAEGQTRPSQQGQKRGWRRFFRG
jgi:hypothetical protein